MMKQTVLLLLCVTIAMASIGCERKQQAKEKEPGKVEQTVSKDTEKSEEEDGFQEEHPEQEEVQVVVNQNKDTTQKENMT